MFYLVLLLCVAASSCTSITSVYPLSENDGDHVVRSELPGTWMEPVDKGIEGEHADVKQRADSLYELVVVHKSYDSLPSSDTNYFIGTLVQVDNYLFLDCVADLERVLPGRGGTFALLSMQRNHFICRLKFRNPNTIDLYCLGDKGSEEVLLKKKVPYYSYLWDMQLLLPSADLKKLLVQLTKEHPKVWEKRTLVRKTAPPAPSPGTGKKV